MSCLTFSSKMVLFKPLVCSDIAKRSFVRVLVSAHQYKKNNSVNTKSYFKCNVYTSTQNQTKSSFITQYGNVDGIVESGFDGGMKGYGITMGSCDQRGDG